MARLSPQLTGVLPPRYLGTEWQPPSRLDEEAALRLGPAQAIVELLRPLVEERRAARMDEVAASRLSGVVVVLEDLHDPHNGGAVLRSSEAMGVHEVHIIASRERFRVSDKVTQGADKWLGGHRAPLHRGFAAVAPPARLSARRRRARCPHAAR
jgi:hypothetical protein